MEGFDLPIRGDDGFTIRARAVRQFDAENETHFEIGHGVVSFLSGDTRGVLAKGIMAKNI
jgi:hypothetical protein